MKSWKDGAERFRALDDGVGWPFAVAVGCSVEPNGTGSKTTISAFAKAAGSSLSRITNYYRAYLDAAEKGLLPANLTPEDLDTVALPSVAWAEFYQPRNSKTARMAEFRRAFKQSTEAIVDAMDSDQRRKVADEIQKRFDEDHAGLRDSRRKADARAEQRRTARHTEAFISADTDLLVTRRALSRAVEHVHEVSLTDEERDLLRESIMDVHAIEQRFMLEVEATSTIDWDSEAANL